MGRDFHIKGLSEFAIHTSNMAAMADFYGEILGLEPFAARAGGTIQFFRLGNGVEGLTAVVALFEAGGAEEIVSGRGAPASSLHHLALAVSRADQDVAEIWFAENNIATRVEDFPWVGWRGLFVADPDGNIVELVARDAALYETGA